MKRITTMFWQHSMIAVLCISMIATTACTSSTWPLIIATAQAAANITSMFYPQVGKWSGLAVSLLQQVEGAATAYKANPNATTEQKYVAAITAIQQQLPADLQTLGLPAADQQKVTAVMSIILDYVDALAGQLPASAPIVAQARANRSAGSPPKPMTKADIKTRWAAVCSGDQNCLSLVK